MPVFLLARPDASGPYYPPIVEPPRFYLRGVCSRVRLTRFARAKKSAMSALGIAHQTAWSADE
ncbi:hypothetical protein WI61_03710 [Burkholderia cepacia]|nr:hypothetical protein WI25_19920 [Burkholderia cepacia]KVA56551.1 hypothetical protein WI47_04935 [Burkholderia cepacia]KVA62328.1 hypothetical protein WI49_24085 [Burkholderia cepacia]KVA63954.1 hypothetical protein WI48_07875 [Burkholderia cepacia]KVA77271.1 hypothetical protein WI50_35120 [Burkholderia cepacia]